MVSHAAEVTSVNPNTKKFPWHITDRWVFVFMSGLLFIIVLMGFVPSSIDKVAQVQVGERPPFLPILHVHAVLMGSWLLLLMAQTSLIAGNHRAIHRKLGMISMVLMPAIVIAGFLLVPQNFQLVWNLDAETVPEGVIAARKFAVSNIALFQIRIGIFFMLFVGLALYFRKTDSETHKRLMILATILPIPAAIQRMTWIPTSFPESGLAPDIEIFLLVLPLFAYDLIRHRRIPRAWYMWGAGWIGSSLMVHSLWGSPWWLETVPKIMGVEAW